MISTKKLAQELEALQRLNAKSRSPRKTSPRKGPVIAVILNGESKEKNSRRGHSTPRKRVIRKG